MIYFLFSSLSASLEGVSGTKQVQMGRGNHGQMLVLLGVREKNKFDSNSFQKAFVESVSDFNGLIIIF